MRPLCFVLMPFGTRPAPGGGILDFEALYRELIAPGIQAAGLEPIRAEGIIHKPMGNSPSRRSKFDQLAEVY